ncbi:hypothetical protein BP5796_02612 [Coleophoma crateriformis]|uniref:Uncharacterized protein n=1 Tax=Coleophoma crateriformis TaxID=565419 RepID=A0A3D8SYP8_9HELO|nr:hypothetical protein BP5796_02612 [Coleophoma crateriformis]
MDNVCGVIEFHGTQSADHLVDGREMQKADVPLPMTAASPAVAGWTSRSGEASLVSYDLLKAASDVKYR